MLALTLNLARSLRPDRVVVVVGFQRHLVRERFGAEDIFFVDQEEQLGTGHAVLIAGPAFKNFFGTVLILCGDVPLLTEKTIKRFIEFHKEEGNTLSVLTTRLEDPTGYGRIFRGKKGELLRIVEQKDLAAGENAIREINTGIYCVEARFLFKALSGLSNQNAQREFYLTDIVVRASSQGEKAAAYLAEDPTEVMGINTRRDLAKASQYLRRKMAERHMLQGQP
jgi:bifunctional UDP-N-acetylglucosamine pyrophosphorylase/glucosamine-1-phosphate N-acetyltransferase